MVHTRGAMQAPAAVISLTSIGEKSMKTLTLGRVCRQMLIGILLLW
jgi:hypothetical protein